MAAFIGRNLNAVAAKCPAADALHPVLQAVVKGCSLSGQDKVRAALTAFKSSRRYAGRCDNAGCSYSNSSCRQCGHSINSTSNAEMTKLVAVLEAAL